MESLLRVKNLNVTIEGKEILKDISFEVMPQEVLSIIGPNGAGKSVLLKAILGILPVTGGKIEFGKGVKVGYLPQRFAVDRYLPMTVEEFLRLKPGVTTEQIRESARALKLDASFLKKSLASLSSGQMEKALIAWVIADRPNLIFFDEPTENIDVAGQESVYQLIDTFHHQLKIAVVLVSHDLNVVYRYSHRVMCLNQKMQCFGAPIEMLTNDVLQRLYGEHAVFEHHHHV